MTQAKSRIDATANDAIGFTAGDMLPFAQELFPICRSICGPGLRETLTRIAGRVPLEIEEVATGTPAFDWQVPQEWRLRRATLRGPGGNVLADTDISSLQVVNCSVPVRQTIPLAELRPYLHSLPGRPDAVPYRTSYYSRTWGFCLADRVARDLPEGEYEVDIDSTFYDGSISLGSCVVPGDSSDQIVLSTHCCHPSLANDNLSGIVIAMRVASELRRRASRRLTVRLLFMPGTIGAITWLARHVELVPRIRHGLVLSCLGDRRGAFVYKQSRRGDAAVDRVVPSVLAAHGYAVEVRPFIPYGYDERQFCSPGFDLPFGCLMRTPNGEYAEYHTSDDNLSLLDEAALEGSVAAVLAVVDEVMSQCDGGRNRRGSRKDVGGLARRVGADAPASAADASGTSAGVSSAGATSAVASSAGDAACDATGDIGGDAATEAAAETIVHAAADLTGDNAMPAGASRIFVNTHPFCEPQLGRRGLYAAMGGAAKSPAMQMALLWVLNLSDGRHDLAAIAARAGEDLRLIETAAAALEGVGLLRAARGGEG